MTAVPSLLRRAILSVACLISPLLLAQCRPSDSTPKSASEDSAASPPAVSPADAAPSSLPATPVPPPFFFIAIIDSGIDPAHPLFANAFAATEQLRGFVPDALLAQAGPSFLGWDLVEDGPEPLDHTGHGTHVAGILARELAFADNDSPFRLLIFRTGNKIHRLDHLTRAVTLASDFKKAGLPIPLVVLPLEYYPDPAEADLFAQFETALESLLDDHSLAVCAAGNKGQNNDDPSGKLHCYPSDFPFPNLLSIASCNESGHLHPLSNFGPTSVDLAAPGFGIESATLRGGLQQATGSSQACAFAAARAARLWIADRQQTSPAIRRAIIAETVVHPSLVGHVASNGYLPRLPPAEPADPPP